LISKESSSLRPREISVPESKDSITELENIVKANLTTKSLALPIARSKSTQLRGDSEETQTVVHKKSTGFSTKSSRINFPVLQVTTAHATKAPLKDSSSTQMKVLHDAFSQKMSAKTSPKLLSSTTVPRTLSLSSRTQRTTPE